MNVSQSDSENMHFLSTCKVKCVGGGSGEKGGRCDYSQTAN